MRRSSPLTYNLYLESGPRRKKTMVHVPGLLGCVAVGPTTGAALKAAPGAIRANLRYLKRHGEKVRPAARFETRVAEHITEGQWQGNGSPCVTYKPDLVPVSARELDLYLNRFR